MSNSDLNPYEGANSGSYSGQDPEQDSVSSDSENVTSGHVGNNVAQMVIPNSYSDGSDSGQSEDNNATSGTSHAWKGKGIDDSFDTLDINRNTRHTGRGYLNTSTTGNSHLEGTSYADGSSGMSRSSRPPVRAWNTGDDVDTGSSLLPSGTLRISEPSPSHSSSSNHESASGTSNRGMNLDGRPTLPYILSSRSTQYWNYDPYMVYRPLTEGYQTVFLLSGGFNSTSGASSSFLNRPSMPFQLSWPENTNSITHSYHPMLPLYGGFNSRNGVSSSFLNRPSMPFQLPWPYNTNSITHSYHLMPIVMPFQLPWPYNTNSITHSYHLMPIMMPPPFTSPWTNIMADEHDQQGANQIHPDTTPPLRRRQRRHQVPQQNGGWALEDRFHALRLDIDHMGYEELLALEDRIGNAKLKSKNMYMKKTYGSSSIGAPLEAEGGCIICLEKLVAEDAVGVLDCAHDQFHIKCIKEWLQKYKNKCPICNKTGLSGK